MAGYFDASLVLSALLEQQPAGALERAWAAATPRLGSSLLPLECIIGLRRVARSQGLSAAWVEQRLAVLDRIFPALTIKPVDAEIEAGVRHEPRLAGCRTLDAVHIATALYYQRHLSAPLKVYSLDDRMRVVATELGFAVGP